MVAYVLLENNNLVLANNVSGNQIQLGEMAHIRIYRSAILGRRSYDIYKTDLSTINNKSH